jgi:hypothetical protein
MTSLGTGRSLEGFGATVARVPGLRPPVSAARFLPLPGAASAKVALWAGI